jgi:hypothetical protein
MVLIERYEYRVIPSDTPGEEDDGEVIDWDVIMELDYEDDPDDLTPQKIGLYTEDHPIIEGDKMYVYMITTPERGVVKFIQPCDPAEGISFKRKRPFWEDMPELVLQ